MNSQMPAPTQRSTMNVISIKTLKEAASRHSAAAAAIYHWIKIAKNAQWENLAQTRNSFRHADQVRLSNGRVLTVFNLGSSFRLITAIHYNRRTIYVREILSHAEYDKETWKAKH